MTSTTDVRRLDELPVYNQWDSPGWGRDLGQLAREFFSSSNQGVLRGSDGSAIFYQNAHARTLLASKDATHQNDDGLLWQSLGRNPVELIEAVKTTTFSMRGAEHRQTKGLTTRRFTTNHIQRYAAAAQAAVAEQLAEVGHGEVIEFVKDFSQPVVSRFWSRLLGLTPDEAAVCTSAACAYFDSIKMGVDADDIASAEQAAKQYWATMRVALERGIKSGHYDLLNELSDDFNNNSADIYPQHPGVAFAAALPDSFHTLPHATGGVVHALWSAPDSLSKVQSNPSLVSMAVMEGMRIHSPVVHFARETVADFEIAGVHIPTGTVLTIFLSVANRDPEVFADPDEFKLDRPNQSRQVTFGGGTYMCTGRNIAKLIADTIVAALTGPGVTVELAGDAHWEPRRLFHELETMPVKVTHR